MGERRWRLTKDGEQERLYLWSDKYQDWLPRDELLPPPPSGPSLTDAEVLAEMPTEALVEELRRRGFQPDAQSGGWSTVVAKGAGDG